MKLHFIRKKRDRGFSLTEMVTVVGVIGVISAIAFPNLGNVNKSAKETVAKRNAQHIASVFQSAKEAGLYFIDSGGNLDNTVSNVVSGGLVEGGAFDGSFFGLPGISAENQIEARKYLAIAGDDLQYQGVLAGTIPVIDSPDNPGVTPPPPEFEAEQPVNPN